MTHSSSARRVSRAMTCSRALGTLSLCSLAGALLVAPASRALAQKPSPDAPKPVSVPAGARTAAPISIPKIPYEKFTLPNGLTVLLSEDHSAPVAAMTVWYHVGSKNEKPGRTGFAHLFEHVMFMGSQNVAPGQFDKVLEAAGAENNGSTTEDRTNYYITMPSNALDDALWLDSDRMGFLLPTLDQAKLDAQREVVKNERRFRVDNQPFGSRFEILGASLYPESHPYHWPVIGSMADLSAASLDDVKEFFRKYYAPNNATIVIAGDIDPVKTKAQLTRYFAEVPRGPAIERPVVPQVPLAAEKRLVLEDAKARLPQLAIAWPTVGVKQADDAPLSALGRVLAQDRTSRLTKLLVYDRQLASSVGVFQNSSEDAGAFYITVTPRPNASLTEIERLTDSVVAKLVEAPPTAAELQRFKNYVAVGTVTGLQSVLGKAETLAEGQAFFNDPAHYQKELQEVLKVTPADVHRVARQYLTPGRVVLSMVPAGKLDQISKPDLPYTNATPKPSVQ
jgi:zinc protease